MPNLPRVLVEWLTGLGFLVPKFKPLGVCTSFDLFFPDLALSSLSLSL